MRADVELGQGQWRGPMHGVPIAIKDLIDVAGVPTTSGTEIMKGCVPAADATIVARLKRAGTIVIGKTHMTEAATLDHHPSYKRPDNPWKSGFWTGVSSSGSGVSVAAGFCYGALGSDTGGSIRMPSSACGLSGIKPTWGRVSLQAIYRWRKASTISARCAGRLPTPRQCCRSSQGKTRPIRPRSLHPSRTMRQSCRGRHRQPAISRLAAASRRPGR